MTYKIGGIEILQPTSGQWIPRRPIDVTGEGRTIYAGVYEFELRWALMPMDKFNEIYDAYQEVAATGTLVVELPDFTQSSYAFREFSGVFVEEPRVGAYFQEHVSNVVLRITNIAL